MLKRVLMSADTIGGVWTYALDLTRSLAPYEVEVVLATMGAPLSDGQWQEARTLSNLQVEESSLMLEWMDQPWADVDAAGEWLLDLEQKFKPDVVHLNGYSHAALPFDSPIASVCHSCVLSWWEAVKGEKAPPGWQEYARRVRRGLQNADAVVAPTFGMLAEADRFYGPFGWSEVIPNGRRRDLFAPGQKECFVLTAGRAWDEAKNMAALNRAAVDIRCPVFIAGEASESFRNLIPLGRLSSAELSSWYGRAAIYAMPALYEPFGLSILEAALSGCALVLGDIPSLRENWLDAALFVDPKDSQAIRAAIEGLLDDEEVCRSYGRKALERAARFYPENTGRRYYDLYQQLLTASNPCTKAMVI